MKQSLNFIDFLSTCVYQTYRCSVVRVACEYRDRTDDSCLHLVEEKTTYQRCLLSDFLVDFLETMYMRG